MERGARRPLPVGCQGYEAQVAEQRYPGERGEKESPAAAEAATRHTARVSALTAGFPDLIADQIDVVSDLQVKFYGGSVLLKIAHGCRSSGDTHNRVPSRPWSQGTVIISHYLIALAVGLRLRAGFLFLEPAGHLVRLRPAGRDRLLDAQTPARLGGPQPTRPRHRRRNPLASPDGQPDDHPASLPKTVFSTEPVRRHFSVRLLGR